MEAKKLMIGNYVKDPYNNTIRLVSVEKSAGMLRPLPITEEWLIDLGFEKTEPFTVKTEYTFAICSC